MLRKFIKAVFVVFLFLIVLVFVLVNYLSPDYKGQVELKGLSDKVVAYFDENGVPHIEAHNQSDAYKVLGFIHAQDRLWQMEVVRRIAAGRLSEVFGEDLISVDKFMGSLGIESQAYKTISNLDKNSQCYNLTKSYLEGVNEFIENGKTPLEFYLLGIKKEVYTLKDIYNVFGYMAFSFDQAHKTDPLVQQLYSKLGKNYIDELGIPLKNTTLLESQSKNQLDSIYLNAIEKVLNAVPFPKLTGSNSWVLNGERTKNGKVIFANDPHIEYGQPSVWYQNHIKTPSYEMYGFNLALTPFPLLGHNKEYAYGLTMFLNDDIDFYLEKNNPDNPMEYLTDTGYERYKVYNKEIKVKGGGDVLYDLKHTKHGPVMNNLLKQIENKGPISMQWVYTKLPNKALEVTYGISHSDSLKMFEKSVKKNHAPGLNFMYGDKKNNIAWFASGKLYTYRDSLNRNLFLNGYSGKDEVVKYLDFRHNPKLINPKKGYVYSANNQPDSVKGSLYPGYYASEDRAKRIQNIISDKHDFTQSDIQDMIVDVKSSVVTENIKNISQLIDVQNLNQKEKKVLDHLINWDGAYVQQDVAPTIYNRFVYEFFKNTYRDEMGRDLFDKFMGGLHLQKKLIAVQLQKKESVWWDNVLTENVKETKTEIISKSLKDAVGFLTQQLGNDVANWCWSRVIQVEHEHPIGKAGGFLRWFFNVGPYNVNGGDQIINNKIFNIDSTGYYKVKAGASTRRVIDFSQLDNAVAILPTGQSGNRFSPFYKDQSEKYVNDEFVKMYLNPKFYRRSKNRLVFLPLKD